MLSAIKDVLMHAGLHAAIGQRKQKVTTGKCLAPKIQEFQQKFATWEMLIREITLASLFLGVRSGCFIPPAQYQWWKYFGWQGFDHELVACSLRTGHRRCLHRNTCT